MKPIYTEEEFVKAKSRDKLALECKICGNIFHKEKRIIQWTLRGDTKRSGEYCSNACSGKGQEIGKEYECANCGTFVYRAPCERAKVKNVFCGSSCAATYNNLHKQFGTRRSKLEVWIEKELSEKYEFEILYNDKLTINAELDIYVPHLKLAFELNGIYHYEPIHGPEKLAKIQSNDERKYQACLERGIELCLISTQDLRYNKPERFKKYLEIIETVIKQKCYGSK